ncbi:MAG: LamG domain-containing protein [Ignavibacteriae bacterium]|nr:LamG domain-containing protein [Ignavibacteria bacterium]MBI3365322.1 LamG domain-containing protein [Ignavibacteriota bacterium]
MQLLRNLSLAALILSGLSCKDDVTAIKDPQENQVGKVALSLTSAPEGISKVVARLLRRGYDAQILELTISNTGPSATGTFRNVSIGQWHLKVDALDDSNVVRFTGETDVDVFPGETSNVELLLLPANGNIDIHVTWGRMCAAVPFGVVSWWPGDGSPIDIMGGNNGDFLNGTSYAAGLVGEAFSFDGVDDRMNVGDPDNLKITGSLTIEAWVKIASFPDSNSGGVILFRGDDRSGLDPYAVGTTPDGKILFHIESLTSGTNLYAPVPAGRFVHVAATLDSSVGAMRIYIDGRLAAEAITNVRPFRDLDPESNGGVGIGNHAGFAQHYPFHGLIDELAIYNRELSAREIYSVYAAGSAGKCRGR